MPKKQGLKFFCIDCNKQLKKYYAIRCLSCAGKHKLFSKSHRKNLSIALKGRSIPSLLAEKNPAWKGDKVGYIPLHRWVRKHLGTPKACAYCGHEGRIEWASISHKARRDLSDYIPLCPRCHRQYDGIYAKMWLTRKSRSFWKGCD